VSEYHRPVVVGNQCPSHGDVRIVAAKNSCRYCDSDEVDALRAELAREREKVVGLISYKSAHAAIRKVLGIADKGELGIPGDVSTLDEVERLVATVKAMGEAQTKAMHTLEDILEGISDRNDDWVVSQVRAALASLAPVYKDINTAPSAERPKHCDHFGPHQCHSEKCPMLPFCLGDGAICHYDDDHMDEYHECLPDCPNRRPGAEAAKHGPLTEDIIRANGGRIEPQGDSK